MKIYKIIFRFDYPLNYSLLDKLGSKLDYIKKNSESKPFVDVRHQIDLTRHLLTSRGNFEENIFQLNLSVNTFDGTIDFKNGLPITELVGYKFFNFIDSVINQIDVGGVYDRIGFRLVMVDGSEPLEFDKVLKLMIKKNEDFCDPFDQNFKSVSDFGITLESINEDRESLRVILGPYKKSEGVKFFLTEHDVEGVMIDMDLFQLKLKVPQFSLINFIKKNQNVFIKVSSGMIDKIKKDIQV